MTDSGDENHRLESTQALTIIEPATSMPMPATTAPVTPTDSSVIPFRLRAFGGRLNRC
jgi:hypothetical protein